MKVLILGANGFIGSTLADKILATTDWEIHGFDISNHNLNQCLNHPRFTFQQGNIFEADDWIDEQVSQCDVVLPLVAVANPAVYVKDPLKVFELDFESNLKVVRKCVQHQTRVVFPSTSEVYGMCPDHEFKEDESPLVLGPVHMPRWIYSCSKQMLDRVICAYGMQQGLQYSLFRPFNWMGPRLDNVKAPQEGSSRVLTQFISNVLYGRPLKLVDGGLQKRSFTYIDDGIDGLMAIIRNENHVADHQAFNLGNPSNHISIRELAYTVRELIAEYPAYRDAARKTEIIEVNAQQYYGQGYQDVPDRVPSIAKAKQLLGWEPKISLRDGLKKTLDYYLGDEA